MGASDDLIALYWTTSGPVEVHFGREWSLFDLRDRCEQAARVGFRGIGLWHADLEHVLETRTLREVRALLDEHGLDQLELEFLGDWFLDPERRAPAAPPTRDVRCCSERRPSCPPTTSRSATSWARSASCRGSWRGFAELCADAARYTDAKIVYEFMPYDVQVNDVDTALEVVEGADAPNGGARVRHLAPGQAAARARRAAPHPAAVRRRGSSSATAPTSTRRTGSTR